VNALRRFEDWVNDALEGGLGGLLGAQIQPVDIAKRLAEHMEDHRTIGAGRVYVPNIFRAYLAPRTLLGVASFQVALEDELAAFLDARAREGGFHFLGRVRVRLLADPALRAERLRIEADLVDRHGLVVGPAGQGTEAIALPAARPAEAPRAVALVVGRRRLAIDHERPVTIGRALDNDASISRHHARLVPRGTHWMLEDLGSTHGSFVNGHGVTASLLRAGDRIRLGGVALRIEAREAPQSE